eukprot:1604221-Pleurochrysis_carterae.AAC.1
MSRQACCCPCTCLCCQKRPERACTRAPSERTGAQPPYGLCVRACSLLTLGRARPELWGRFRPQHVGYVARRYNVAGPCLVIGTIEAAPRQSTLPRQVRPSAS